MAAQTPTRYSVPDPGTNRALQDLYDKLTRLQPAPVVAPPVAPAAPASKTTTFVSISGASGQAAGPQLAFIPELVLLPSVNPTQGAPFAQDGVLIEYNKQFRRYNGTTFAWDYAGTATAILTGTHAARVSGYPAANYLNALFYESDTSLTLISNGVSWQTVSGQITDTHANRLALWPSVQFSAGTFVYESNRTVRYWSQDAVGTVAVAAGVNVTWLTGNHFVNTGSGFTAAQWPTGTTITINGIVCFVSVVNSPTSLTLSVATTNTAGTAYSVASGRWVYLSGRYEAPYASGPTDLGENDSSFEFYDSATYVRQWEWSGTAWKYSSGQLPGGDSAPAISILAGNSVPPGWALCNGAVVTITKADATTVSFTTPNMQAGYYPKGGAYSATPVVVLDPVIGPVTPVGSVSQPTFAGTPKTWDVVNVPIAGGVQSVLKDDVTNNPYTPAGVVSQPTFTGAPVTPVVTVSGEPEHIVMPYYVKL
jgi:hypothetical protein